MKWPFGKRNELAPETARESVHEANIQKLREWRRVGQSFTYLGREFVVTGHSDYMSGGLCVWAVARLSANYSDENGVIHSMWFSFAEAAALMEAQP